MTSITTRPAAIEDFPAIVEIGIKAWQESYRGIFPDHLLDNLSIEEKLKTRIEKFKENTQYTLVAINNDEVVVGYCDFGISRRPQFGKGEIYSIYTLPNLKNMGIGKLLMHKSMEILEEQLLSPYIVTTLEANIPAQKFYEKLGFIAIDQIMTLVGEIEYPEIVFLKE